MAIRNASSYILRVQESVLKGIFVLCVSVLSVSVADFSQSQHHHHHHHLPQHSYQPELASSSSSSSSSSFASSQHYTFNLLHHYVVHKPSSSSHPAMKPVAGKDRHSTAYQLQDGRPSVEVAPNTVRHLTEMLGGTDEFSILASFRLETLDPCSLLSLNVGHKKWLNLEVGGRRRDVRLSYLHENKARTEMFPVHLRQEQWHSLAISVSRTFVQVFIDCELKYERQLRSIDWPGERQDSWQREDLHFWLGQGDSEETLFQGAIEYINVAIFPQAYLQQCPHADVACPTCSQFRQLESTLQDVYRELDHLREKVQAAENRIADLEHCECMISCEVDGVRYTDGERWRQGCRECSCKSGTVHCEKPTCPLLSCKNPVLLEGHCCAVCLRNCHYSGVPYEHGESFTHDCHRCTCNDTQWECQSMALSCPVLNCSLHMQISSPGHCCNFCRDADYCAGGHNCHDNATCINLETKYTCSCIEGYEGDGTHCTDRDECAEQGQADGHHCRSNSRCVNLPGSYMCACNEGYVSVDQYTCQELDECAQGTHNCSLSAMCVNTKGSYTCICRDGYTGHDNHCSPVCVDGCENGGTCVAPDICLCQEGFTGSSCQNDVDECVDGTAICHPNSDCINVPGSYFCQCRPGYHSFLPDNQHGALCIDADECTTRGKDAAVCPTGAACHNTPGGYQCNCTDPTLCSTDCTYRNRMYASGTSWAAHRNRCVECSCLHGRTECVPKVCDCRSPDVNMLCCPHCRRNASRCLHNGLEYHEREIWSQGCQICQCLAQGIVDCASMECPRLSCSPTIQLDGDCCPRCAHPDPCLDSTSPSAFMGTAAHRCYFDGHLYTNGQSWHPHRDQCTSCSCKEGHVCCSFNQTCPSTPSSPLPRLSLQDVLPDHHRFLQQLQPQTPPERPRKRPRKQRRRPFERGRSRSQS